VGCGAGETLRQLHDKMGEDTRFVGYEISPQAFDLCQARASKRISFRLADITQEESEHFDLILVMDVVEHLEDYFTFLREIRDRAEYKIFHFPLDLSVQTIARPRGLIRLREMYRHLHYFTKDLALTILEDTGYEIMDWFYTARSIDLPSDARSRRLARVPRRIAFAIHQDLAVRVLGGFSLLVLAT
jgi:2-polyprenyl-3-methyl-5-hydroxy-6-metoxy-1,4-benzoquinol methylase